MPNGKFIVIEGLDGSGNSTQSKMLCDFLNSIGHKSILTKEPTSGFVGKYIRSFFKKEFECPPAYKQILFAADRAIHLTEEIEPKLNAGVNVVCDRYILSSIAFGGSEKLPPKWLMSINFTFIVPDLTILLKVDPKICIERISKRGSEKEFFEEQEKLVAVWRNYEYGKSYFQNVHIINGEQSLEKVHEDIKKLATKEVEDVKTCSY